MNLAKSVSIRPIDKTTVNKICSGQVILNLATAVKELLENSIDAGATIISIKLEEYGSDIIEVTDNGCGVEEDNFQGLTLKHHTSKISKFTDLNTVETFGFRGEALSSLCSLSDVTIITRHKNTDIGTTLKFDHNGIIKYKEKTVREVGTTVRLQNLFCTLPIRRAEFLKNLKKEFSKMCNILYAYGLQSKITRITCINHVSSNQMNIKEDLKEPKSKKISFDIIMNVKGDSTESNIRAIFGKKIAQNLLKFEEKVPSNETLNEFGLENTRVDVQVFKLNGFISSCEHGYGRNTADRQFFYINSRPIDNQKISKLVNNVYHLFNSHQYPFIFLDIKVRTDSLDVNVTPDKRLIFIHNEKILLAILKESLLSVFKNVQCTLRVQNIGVLKPFEDINIIKKWDQKFEVLKANCKKDLPQSKKITQFCSNLYKFQGTSYYANGDSPIEVKHESYNQLQSTAKKSIENGSDINQVVLHKVVPSDRTMTVGQEVITQYIRVNNSSDNQSTYELESSNKNYISSVLKEKEVITESSCDIKRKLNNIPDHISLDDVDQEQTHTIGIKRIKLDRGLTKEDKKQRCTMKYDISLEAIKEMALRLFNTERTEKKSEIKFLAEIKPQSNERAEAELKKVIKKESFSEMEILGQFNLGFIITKLDYDIFIVDQHASDEKYNFEILQSSTVLQTQKMFHPETLNLTADKEELMVQQQHVFKKNGFDFVFNINEKVTRRIKLTGIPLSQNVVFGKDDIDELLFLLEDAPNTTTLRPLKVKTMFASRACRKSVMIGTSLNYKEMRRIINHMGEIEQPWNCPHGRPTMRHLVNLHLIRLPK